MLTIINNHLSQSTAHGVSNIFKHKRLSIRIIWCLLTSTVLVGFIIHSSILINKLLDDKVYTTISPTPFVQPDIVFCFNHPFDYYNIRNPPQSEREFMTNISTKVNNLFNENPGFPDFSSYISFDKIGLRDIYKAFYRQRETLVVQMNCFLQEIHNYSFEFNYQFYSCARITAKHCPLGEKDETIFAGFYMNSYTSDESFPNRLDTNESMPFYTKMLPTVYPNQFKENAVVIFFSSEGSHTTLTSEPVVVKGNSNAIITLNAVQYKHQNRKDFPCNETETYSRYHNMLFGEIGEQFVNYSHLSLCHENNIQSCMFANFNCVLSILPIPDSMPANVSLCFKEKSKNIYVKYWFTKECLLYSIKSCKNQRSCNHMKYEARVQTKPLDDFKQLLNGYENQLKLVNKDRISSDMKKFIETRNISEKWKRNFIKVQINKRSSFIQSFEESFAYTMSNLLADIGGIFGFYLGASVLTVCEIFSLLHELFCQKLESGAAGPQAIPV